MDEKSKLNDELVAEFTQEPEPLDMTPLESIKSLVRQALGYDDLTPMDLTRHISVALRSSTGSNAIVKREEGSGVVSFFATGEYPASSLKVSIVSAQDAEGWPGVNLYHNDKNFCDPSKWVPGSVGNDPTKGGFVLVPSANAFRNTGIKLPAGTYTFSSAGVSHAAVLYIYKTTGEVNSSKTVWTRTAFPITRTIAEDELVAVVVRKTDVVDADTNNIKLQIERGASASVYEPYHMETISITFPTPPGTVYGGELDVITGVLTVTHDEEGTPLEEPLTYQLDPEELSTLVGENNIWADCGPVESITY